MKIEIEAIEKETLKKCAFRYSTHRFNNHQVRERNQRLFFAMLMGNNFNGEARITFNTSEGYKAVNSRVWATTEKFILLTGGSTIPMESIATVELD